MLGSVDRSSAEVTRGVFGTSADQHVGEMARTELGRAALQYFDDVVRGCRGNPNVKAVPMHFNNAVYGSFNFDFRTFFGPAIILS